MSSLPLATYPAAIKSAAALLAQGKIPEAKTVLQTALNTIVVHDTIIPLPLARAELATDQAVALSAKTDRTGADNAALKTLLTTTREQLRLAKALGYITDADLETMLQATDEIEQKTSGQNHAAGLLDRIKGLLVHAREASQISDRKS